MDETVIKVAIIVQQISKENIVTKNEWRLQAK